METFFLNWFNFWKKKQIVFAVLLLLFSSFGIWSFKSVFSLSINGLYDETFLTISGVILLSIVAFFRKFSVLLLSLLPSILSILFSSIIYYLNGEVFTVQSTVVQISVALIIFAFTIHFFSTLKRTNNIVDTIRSISNSTFMSLLILSVVFWLFYFLPNKNLSEVGFYVGVNLAGGLIGLLFILPVVIGNRISFKSKWKKTSLKEFYIKKRLVRFLVVTTLITLTIWFGFKLSDISISSDLINSNKSIILIGVGVVFILLIMIYGRIEYAIITFLPVLFAAIWMMGLTALLGITLDSQFTTVSFLVVGVSFGSSLVVSDSYKYIYSYGDEEKTAQKTSLYIISSILFLSFLSYLIFDGFSIKSLGFYGIMSTFICFGFNNFFQPYLIKLFILNRVKTEKSPLTVFGVCVSVFAFSYFFIGCVLLFIIHLFFRVIPFGQKNIKSVFRWILSKFSLSMLYIMINTKKRRYNFEELDFSEPKIIIANHQSFLDILLMIGLSNKVVIMTNEWVYKSPFFGLIIRYAGYLRAAKGIDSNLDEINERIADGLSVMIFPEGTRSKTGEIKRFHKGAFYLSEKTGLPIQPIIIQACSYTMSKGDYLLKNSYMNLKALPTITFNNQSFSGTYKERTKLISKYVKKEYAKFDYEFSDSVFQFNRVITNYILKNPITEWYIRIKWKFESKNYDFYDGFLKDDSVVYDLGCGYGYMSYYFAFRGPNRTVIGMDYDKEKIAIAQNCFDRSDKIQFASGDIRTFKMQNADAILLTDVIHYLPKEDQFGVLKRCVDALSENGVLFLRDGISDYQERHEKTKLTEKFSTKILGFNKSENELHFFSKQDVFDFAKENNLSCELKEQSQKTSNVLFILKK